jgi:hypothetical protein
MPRKSEDMQAMVTVIDTASSALRTELALFVTGTSDVVGDISLGEQGEAVAGGIIGGLLMILSAAKETVVKLDAMDAES